MITRIKSHLTVVPNDQISWAVVNGIINVVSGLRKTVVPRGYPLVASMLSVETASPRSARQTSVKRMSLLGHKLTRMLPGFTSESTD